MFINYFGDAERNSLLNLLLARVVLGVYGIWKLSTINWLKLYQLDPAILSIYSQIIFPEPLYLSILFLLPLVAFSSLSLFLFGYRVRLTSLLSGLSIGLIAIIISLPKIYYSLSTLAHLLLIYSAFGKDDKYSFEKWSNFSFKKICLLSRDTGSTYKIRFLKWMLVYLSLTYFITASNRFLSGGLVAWLNTTALPRTIQYTLELQGKSPNLLADFIISEPIIAPIGMAVTIVVELCFLIFVISKRSINLIILAIISLHILFAVVLNLYALNQLVLIGLLLSWDTMYKKTLETSRKVKNTVLGI